MNQTTTRRTAKITAAYTVVSITYTQAAMIRCTAIEDISIQGINGASVEIKKGEVFYCVKAESLNEQQGRDDLYYIVRLVAGVKKCSCPARKPCKHEIAVAAKTAEQDQAATQQQVPAQPTTQVIVSPGGGIAIMHSDPRGARRSSIETSTLNGNRPFRLMR